MKRSLALGLFLLIVLGTAPALRAAEAEGQETPLQVAFKVFNFVVLFGILGYFIRKPAGEFFRSRTQAIQKSMADAHAAREQAEKRMAEVEERLSRLGDEIKQLKGEASREAANERERLRQAAGAEARKILALAEAEIDGLSRSARLELKAFAAGLAVELAEERIRARMDPETQDRVLRNYLKDLDVQADAGSGGQ